MKVVFWLIAAFLLAPVLVSIGENLRRQIRLRNLRRRLEKFPAMDPSQRARIVSGVSTSEELLELGRFLERKGVSIELKVEIGALLVEAERLSFLSSDWFVRLMKHESPYRLEVAELALRHASSQKATLEVVLRELGTISDPTLAVALINGLSEIAAQQIDEDRRRTSAPTYVDGVAITKAVAHKLGDSHEVVRLAAANVLRTTLVARIVESEGTLMALLRSQRSEVRELVAELVLEHQEELKVAVCGVRAAQDNLSHSLRSRI